MQFWQHIGTARGKTILTAVCVGLAAFFVYLQTLAPSIVFGDSPELVTAAYQAGIAHPTGYPLYTILGNLFIRLYPWGNVAWRMNLLSALAAAATIFLLYFLALRITRSRRYSAAAALFFAFSATFWSQAVITEVYALHLLFVTVVLYCAVVWDAHGDPRWQRALVLVYGLALTHHLMSVLLAPALIYFICTSHHRGAFLREWKQNILLFLAPLLLYLYLPLAALHDPACNWGDPRTWSNFVAHVTGAQFHDAMGCRSFSALWERLVEYGGWPTHNEQHKGNPGYLLSQFSIALLWLAPWGAAALCCHYRRLFGLTGLVYFATVCWALNYDIYDVEVYYIPSHLIIALWIAYGFRQLAYCLIRLWQQFVVPHPTRRVLVTTFSTAMLGLPFLLLFGNWQANDQHRNQGARELGRAILAKVKPNAVVIMGGDYWFFPSLYQRYVEQQRQDVVILPFRDFYMPGHGRLIARYASQGIAVRFPPSHHNRPNGETNPYWLLKQVVVYNQNTRPLYLLGTPVLRLRTDRALQKALPTCNRPAKMLVPLLEVPQSASNPRRVGCSQRDLHSVALSRIAKKQRHPQAVGG